MSSGWGSAPRRAELDALVPQRPVLLVRADGYVSVVNTAALGAATVEGLEGVERDDAGEATGRLRGEANAMAQLWYFESLPGRVIQEAQLRAAGLAASRGVTCVHEMAIPDKRGRRDVEVLLGHADDLPVDLITYVADRDLPWVVGDLGQQRIGGDLFLDGSIGAHTAALSMPYADANGPAPWAWRSRSSRRSTPRGGTRAECTSDGWAKSGRRA